MATTSNTYTGNGSNKLFSITFPYLDIGDIKVYLNNGLQTITTQYTFASITQIEFVTAPANGAVVDIRRETTIDTPEATFFIGSPVRANDLNDNNNQLLYLAQETQNSLDGIEDRTQDAIDAVSVVVPYVPVANLAALLALTPVNGTYYELQDSTGANSPTITSIPIGLVGSSGLTFRLRYNGTSFVFQNYFANDSETRYLKLTGGNISGDLNVASDTLFVDSVNDRVGIGTNSPESSLSIQTQGTSNIRGASGRHYDNTTAFSQFKWIGGRARGSVGNPAAVQNNDSLVSFNAKGYKTNAWSDTIGGFYVYAAENWTNTATGSYMTLRGCNTGGVVVSEWARFNQDALLLTNQRDLRFGDSDNSNYVGFQSPATVASNVVWTLPATDGTVNQTLTTNGSGTLAWASFNETRTPVTLTNQTSVEFLTVPTWARRITLTFEEVSSNGTSGWLIQIGDSGGFETAAYRCAGVRLTAAAVVTNNDVNGFSLPSNLASNKMSGIVTVFNANGNAWCAAGTVGGNTTTSLMTSGAKTLSDVLDRIRLTTNNGTDIFDEGVLNVSFSQS